ncbi:MAG: hypothetical protein DRP71_07540 [Verrucomicrobia bacterium]|nr:MAG: hypothetical protein DRP71_07540 [Verrucomicrobiota bacterium]
MIPHDPARRFHDAADFGFSPDADGTENAEALQRAVDLGGTVTISRPGVYSLARTVTIGSDTALVFGAGVSVRKVADAGLFTQVFLNKGALTRTWDRNISIHGLNLIVNGVDQAVGDIYGLRGQVGFFYIRDLSITRFRCLDLGATQFAIHVCTFEDIIIDDVMVTGDKDGVHLGPGTRFTIRNGVFKTLDDAVALNGHDYASGSPELGWIENGVVENCHDLADDKDPIGFFCRILAGGWTDWQEGMEVQNSDSVISKGRIYRVQAKPDGTFYQSVTRPTHESGSQVLDGINWGMVQETITYTAGVRNVTFRDIFLEKPRVAFSIHFDDGRYSRSYYPGAEVPRQEQIHLDGIHVMHPEPVDFLSIDTPVDAVNVTNSRILENRIRFHKRDISIDHQVTQVNMTGCVFAHDGEMELVRNEIAGKEIRLKTTASIELHDRFSATVDSGQGNIKTVSDLTGLTT